MIALFKLYGYYKKGSNKNDYKCFGPPYAIKQQAKILMEDKDISVIVIENPENNHRFKWDPSMDRKWRELTKPQVPIWREFGASKAPQIMTGAKAVIKIGGQVVATVNNASYTLEKK
jgi:hypothetical protein